MTGWVADRGYGYLRWEPDDRQAAVNALVNVDGTGIASEGDLPEDGLVDLTDQPDVRAAVHEEFDRLTSTQAGGQTSGQ